MAGEHSQYAAPTTADVDFITPNYQGSISVITDKAGAVKSRHDYLPFGEEIGDGVGSRTTGKMFTGNDSVRQKYAGMEKDDATGLNHTLWRKDDNWSGRWTSPDPYGGSMSTADPQSFNRYTYCNNDPVNHVDLAGLSLADIGVYQTDNANEAHLLDDVMLKGFRGAISPHGEFKEGGGGERKEFRTAASDGSDDGTGGTEDITRPKAKMVPGGGAAEFQFSFSREFGVYSDGNRTSPDGDGLQPAVIPGARTVAQAVSAALAVSQNGCYDDTSFSPSVTPRNRFFANVANPEKFTKGWHPAFSTHNRNALESPELASGEFAPSTAFERSFLPSVSGTFKYGFVLKYYPGEGMAVTASTNSAMHAITAIEFGLNYPDINVNFASQFLQIAPRCSTH